MVYKKKIYDVMGMANSIMSIGCYGLSRMCKRVGAVKAAMTFHNIGNGRASAMLRCWIKSVDCEDEMDDRTAN